MKDHEKKFKQIYFLIDSLVDEARIEGTIQHRNILDTVDELQKEFNRATFSWKGKSMSRSEPSEPIVGMHGYSGGCVPISGNRHWNTTFSVGVFMWITKATGGVKKGKVKVRVSGLCNRANEIYSEARRVIFELDEGTYKGPKNVKVY